MSYSEKQGLRAAYLNGKLQKSHIIQSGKFRNDSRVREYYQKHNMSHLLDNVTLACVLTAVVFLNKQNQNEVIDDYLDFIDSLVF